MSIEQKVGINFGETKLFTLLTQRTSLYFPFTFLLYSRTSFLFAVLLISLATLSLRNFACDGPRNALSHSSPLPFNYSLLYLSLLLPLSLSPKPSVLRSRPREWRNVRQVFPYIPHGAAKVWPRQHSSTNSQESNVVRLLTSAVLNFRGFSLFFHRPRSPSQLTRR